MAVQATIISYRPHNEKTSRFLNVDELLKKERLEKIETVYKDILASITAYDPNYVETFRKIEKKLHDRIIVLKTEKIDLLDKKPFWKFILLSIASLGIFPLIIYCKKRSIKTNISDTNRHHSQFLSAFKQMESRKTQKQIHPKLEAIQDLEKSQNPDIDQELQRLKSIRRISSSLLKVQKTLYLSIKQQVAFARSLELQEKLKDTHYVINHGQNLELMIVNITEKIFKQEFTPIHYPSERLRHDSSSDTHRPVSWYIKELNKPGIIDDYFRKELICGDAVLESTDNFESALGFFAKNKNIALNPTFKKNLLLTITKDYIPNFEIADKLCSDLIKLMNKYQYGGVLYSICIPKEKFDESCYFSRAFGKPLFPQANFKSDLESMQNGSYNYPLYTTPQIRILTDKIKPEDGYHVIANSTLSNQELLELESEATLHIKAALTGYRITA